MQYVINADHSVEAMADPAEWHNRMQIGDSALWLALTRPTDELFASESFMEATLRASLAAAFSSQHPTATYQART